VESRGGHPAQPPPTKSSKSLDDTYLARERKSRECPTIFRQSTVRSIARGPYVTCVRRTEADLLKITVPLSKSKLFISRSCPILILKTVLGFLRLADVKNDLNNYQGQLLSEKMRFGSGGRYTAVHLIWARDVPPPSQPTQ
jgi:hypothetical protein